MSKLQRVYQRLFGSAASTAKIGKFGSFAAGAPATYSGATVEANIVTLTSLSNWLTGWEAAVVGGNSPTIEDFNAYCYFVSRQLGYLMQAGIPEFDASTTYFIGSLCSDGAGNVYVSKTDYNIGNALGLNANWRMFNVPAAAVFSGGGTYTPVPGQVYIIDDASGATFNLPNPGNSTGMAFHIQTIQSAPPSVSIVLNRYGTEKINNIAANFTVARLPFHRISVQCDGINWWVTGVQQANAGQTLVAIYPTFATFAFGASGSYNDITGLTQALTQGQWNLSTSIYTTNGGGSAAQATVAIRDSAGNYIALDTQNIPASQSTVLKARYDGYVVPAAGINIKVSSVQSGASGISAQYDQPSGAIYTRLYCQQVC